MLQVTIPAIDLWDEDKEEFVNIKEQTLQLEHSLVSISKWEAKWCKPFLSKDIKTFEESIDYIRCMTITQNVDPNVYRFMPDDIIRQVNQYIDAPMTATWFSSTNKGKKTNGEQVTNELIYFWMISLNVPMKCEKWHLNRLLTLIEVCNVKNQKPKKMSKKDVYSQQAALNAARRKQLNSKG